MSQKVTKTDISGMLVATLLVVVGLALSSLGMGLGRTMKEGEDHLTGGLFILFGGIIIGYLIENISHRSN